MSRWYIIHAYSGFENKVRDAIVAEAQRLGLEQLVEAVEVPTEKVTEVRRGKKVTSDRKFFPGYVLAKLNMNYDVYHLVKNTPKVTGFLGSSGKPQPISEAEAARIIRDQEARTAMMAELQKAFGQVVDAAVSGDFSRRVDTEFPDAELNAIAGSINNLVATVDRGLGETGEVLAALANTDLTKRMQAQDSVVARTQNNADAYLRYWNATVENLERWYQPTPATT